MLFCQGIPKIKNNLAQRRIGAEKAGKGGRRSEIRGQKRDNRKGKSEVRGQKAEVGGQRSGNRKG